MVFYCRRLHLLRLEDDLLNAPRKMMMSMGWENRLLGTFDDVGSILCSCFKNRYASAPLEPLLGGG